MLDFVVYLLYRIGLAIASAIPIRFLFAVGQFLGVCAWLVSGNYRRLANRNVAIAFANEKTPREMRRLVRRHFQRLGANLLCSVKLTTMPPEKILRRVTVDNIQAMDREFRARVPVVLVLSHLGIWELFAQLMPKFVGYVRNASVYQKLGNRFIDAHVRRTRGQTGLELFDRQQGFQPVIDLLRSGGGVGVLSDQHAGDHGLWTPFFGRLASTSPLPALLAKRTRAALIAAGVSFVVAIVSVIGASRLQADRLRTELRTPFMAEEAIRQLLQHDDWTQRSFALIKRRVGGFGDDELRQLLVRAGALRFEDPGGEEFWGLRERNHDRLG